MKPKWGWPETSDLRGDIIMAPISTQYVRVDLGTDIAPPNTPVLTGLLTHLDTYTSLP